VWEQYSGWRPLPLARSAISARHDGRGIITLCIMNFGNSLGSGRAKIGPTGGLAGNSSGVELKD
jgi:hypothetical protein